MIPISYEQWVDCITKKCKIPLTKDYIQLRLKSLNDPSLTETIKFKSLYGDEHLNKTIRWFEQALKERL